MIINTIINVIIFSLLAVFHLHLFLSHKSAEDLGVDNNEENRDE